MIGLALLSFGAGIANSFYASHTSWGFAVDVRNKMFQRVQQFSFANLTKYPTSALVTSFTNDVRQIQHTIFMALRIMTRAPLLDRKSTRLNSSHVSSSYAVFYSKKTKSIIT